MNILITVDYQGDFANPTGKLYVEGAETIANNIQENIDNIFFDKHIMTFDTHTRDQYFSSPEYTNYKFDIHCEFGTDGWKPYNIMPRQGFSFISAINTVPSTNFISDKNEFYFLKDKFDIWEGNNNFEKWVENNISKSDNIFIQGVATNYCVFMNAIGFKNRGYNVFIIEDAVMAINDNTAESNIHIMKEQKIKFINFNEIYNMEIQQYIEQAKKHYEMDNTHNVISNIRSELSKYIISNNIQSLVIGVSGGLDSAVVAALCKGIGVPVIGVSIPIESSSDHIEKAHWVGVNYCDYFDENRSWENYSEDIFEVLSGSNFIAELAGFKSFSGEISKGNMKARLRMMTLYDIARKTNGMVMSTDNLSEFNMGFWTLHGDVGDYGLIQNLNKGFEIPQIAKAFGIREDIINQPPSDGLMVTKENTDESQLGATYSEIDAILGFSKKTNNPKVTKIIERYNLMAFKRNGVINISREQIFK